MNPLALRRLCCLALFIALTPRPQAAQDSGPGTGGAVRLAQEARFGTTSRRVLIIGAHPDDEDTDLITILTRGMGIETAYLSLTRGEGGQNLIGNELGKALGVLRTEELLSARRFDGAQQFFTRAYDFGFSKSAESAFTFWPRAELVGDVVAVIRRFKPHVIISIWSGTPADGHGQHQVAGIVAREAFDAAGDPARYPGAERAWQVSKFYRSTRGALPGGEDLTFEGGALDSAVGQSLHQIAARSRSRHRSQDMGQLEVMGAFRTTVHLEARAPGLAGRDDSLFAGIRPEPREANDPHRAAVVLGRAGVVIDGYVDDDEVVPGQVVRGVLSVWNAGTSRVKAKMFPFSRGTWQQRFTDCPSAPVDVRPGAVLSCRFTSTAWTALPPSTPYFLSREMRGALYAWDRLGSDWGNPFQPPELLGRFEIEVSSTLSPPCSPCSPVITVEQVAVDAEVRSRSLDQGLGEVRRPVQIVPRVAISLSPDRLLWPLASARRHPFTVTLEHLARDSSQAMVSLRVPAGWQVTPPKRVALAGEGLRVSAEFFVTAPATVLSGEYPVAAMVVVGADTNTMGVYRIRYPHVEPRNIATTATASVVMAPVVVPKTTHIGYVRGAADRIPEALGNSGLHVKLVTGTELQAVPLDSFRTIVIGPRAYEVDQALQQANARLLAWVERGGTLIVQYQQYQYVAGKLMPRPFTIASPHDRVTEREAKVTILDLTHPLFRLPNRITDADFDGWIQERGLYFAHSWDPLWKSLLEMHDSGEAAQGGSLLVTSLGRGRAVYTGLAFFRQIPAAVPGAWRLFMNLLALGER